MIYDVQIQWILMHSYYDKQLLIIRLRSILSWDFLSNFKLYFSKEYSPSKLFVGELIVGTIDYPNQNSFIWFQL